MTRGFQEDAPSKVLRLGWGRARLGDVTEIIAGQSPPGETYRSAPEGLPFFQGKADFGKRHPIARSWCVAPTKIALPGDILISVRAPVGPTNVADARCCIGRGLAAIRCRVGIDRDFLLATLQFHEEALARKGSGSTFTAINRNDLESLEFDLPPLAEQRRIAAKLAEQLVAVERARAAAEARLNAIKSLSAVYLASHFGRFEKSGWPRLALGSIIAETRNGLYKPDEFYDGQSPILKMFNIGRLDGSWNLDRVDRIRLTPEEEATYRLEPGDILLNRVNSRELVGKCAVVDERTAGSVFESKNIRLRIDRSRADPFFIAASLNASDARRQMGEKLKQIVGQATVNRDDLDGLELVLPPLAEQERIAKALAEHATVEARLSRSIAEQSDSINRLPAALLGAAFSGRL